MTLNGNGFIKRAKNILAIIVTLGVIGTSVWGYVETKVNTAIGLSENRVKTECNVEVAKVNIKIDKFIRLVDLRKSEQRLKILLAGKCLDKKELQDEYNSVQKHMKYIEKELRHMRISK